MYLNVSFQAKDPNTLVKKYFNCKLSAFKSMR